MHAAIPAAARDILPGEILARLRPGAGIDRPLGFALLSVLRDGLQDTNLENASFAMNKAEDQRIKDAIANYMSTWIRSRFEEAITIVEAACDSGPGVVIDHPRGLTLLTILRDGLRDTKLENLSFSTNAAEDQRIKDAIANFIHSWIRSRFQEAITTVEIACGIDPR